MFERKSACLLAPQANTLSQEIVAQAPVQLEDLELEEIEFHKIEVNIEQEQGAKEEAILSRKGYIFQSIQELAKEGLPMRVIATELKVSRQTVRKYLKAQAVPRYTPRPHRSSKLDLYKPYIAARWREGVCKGIQLFLEIKERGYDGSWGLVGNYVAKYRVENPPANTKSW